MRSKRLDRTFAVLVPAALPALAALLCSPPAFSATTANQPYSGLWFTGSVPDTSQTRGTSILNWNPATDPDAAFNVGTVPLAPRFYPTSPNANTPNTQVGVDALAAFGSESQGTNVMTAYTPTYWQYVKQEVYWGGSSGSGNILAPNGAVIDAAHRNGVPILGNVFFAPSVYGGNINQVNAMLQQRADGSFPVADKMIQAAQYFHFDGWFINQETEGGNSSTATKMAAFIQYMHTQAPAMLVDFYDSMRSNGTIGYSNALDGNNQYAFQKSGTTGTAVNAKVADSMFLNYNWSGTGLANSATLAGNLGRSKYNLFAGIDTESAGPGTNVNWAGIFPTGNNASANTSIGLYRPDQTYNYGVSGTTTLQKVQSFINSDSKYWMGANADATNTTAVVSGTTWNGIANWVAPASAASGTTFATSFNTGQGINYAVNGTRYSSAPQWSNLGLQDIQPTYRWWMTSTGTKLTPAIDITNAYFGAASLKITGATAAANVLKLFATQIPVLANTNFKIAFTNGSAFSPTNLDLALTFTDNSTATVPVGSTTVFGWNTAVLSLGNYAGKTISTIGLQVNGSASNLSSYTMNIGQLAVYNGAQSTPASPANIKQVGGGATDTSLSGTVRLQWTPVVGAYEYNVYQRLSDNSINWVGGSPESSYFVQDVRRQGGSNFVNLEFETVGSDFGISASHSTKSVYVDWSRSAQTLTWQSDGATTGGSGKWDKSATTWYAGSPAPANQYWSNAWNDYAVFDGTAGTVTLAAPITAGGIIFISDAYNITGTNTLTFSGTAPAVSVPTAGMSATINAPIIGGFTKSGAGNLVLSAATTNTATTIVSAGKLTVANATALGTGPVSMAGGTLSLAVPLSSQLLNGFSTFTMNKGAAGNGPNVLSNILTLTDGIGNEGNSAFTSTAQPISPNGFTASFTYQNNTGADGVAFVIQHDSRESVALGAAGGSFGYAGAPGVGIANSGAIEFNIYTGGTVGTTFATNGGTATVRSTSPVNLITGFDPIGVTLTYNGVANTLLEKLTDLTTNATFSTTYTGVNFNTLLGGNTGYIGFTGGSGAVTSTQTITNFTFNNTFAAPSIANNISSTANTISAIDFPVSPGQTSMTIGALTLNSGSTIHLTSSPSVAGTPGVLIVPLLSITSASLDLTSTDLIVQNGDLASLTALVKTGLNLAAGGYWDGLGINSSISAADTSYLTGIGIILNNNNGNLTYGAGKTFDGTNPSITDVLLKRTFYGDANLDGRVDGTDYSQIDNAFGTTLTGWVNGDFNYDGIIDGSDYALIDNAFNMQSRGIIATTAAQTASIAAETYQATAVPEPIAQGFIFLASGLLMRRNRKVVCR